MNRTVKLKDFIDIQIQGDWGTDYIKNINDLKVFCVRGADIDNVNIGDYSNLPIRYIQENHKKRILSEGSIIIEVSGGSPTQSTGRVSYIREATIPIICSNFCRAFKIKSNYSSKYFYYLVKNIYNSKIFFNFESKTTGIKNLLLDIALDSIEVPFHDLKKQNAIVELLTVLDNKIELNNRINAELEAMAKTIYDYWFVQFEFPFDFAQGKPDKNGRRSEPAELKPYKSSGGKMVWNEELKREIPEGWEVKLLSDWIEKDKSGDWGKESEEGNYTERVHCIRGADINGLNGKGEVKAPVRYILPKNSHKILEPFDLIIEISGGSPTQSTGRLAFLIEETISRFDAPVICSNFCKAVTLKYQKSLFNFVFEWNNAYDNGVLLGFEGKTSGIKNLLFESFVTSYKTAVPPLKLMEDFFQNVYFSELKKQKLLKENNELAALRDWLLPMLMNGQVKVN